MQAKVKTKGAAQPLVVTANRLRDGRVVWLAAGGRWAELVAEAEVYVGDAVEAGLALGADSERKQVVVGAYAAEVAMDGGHPVPLRAREKLRADGPSVGAVAA